MQVRANPPPSILLSDSLLVESHPRTQKLFTIGQKGPLRLSPAPLVCAAGMRCVFIIASKICYP